jgi:hypothetical protein
MQLNLAWNNTTKWQPDQYSEQAAGWTAMELWFKPQQGQGTFFCSKMSMPALKPTQPLIQWVLRALSLECKAVSA